MSQGHDADDVRGKKRKHEDDSVSGLSKRQKKKTERRAKKRDAKASDVKTIPATSAAEAMPPTEDVKMEGTSIKSQDESEQLNGGLENETAEQLKRRLKAEREKLKKKLRSTTDDTDATALTAEVKKRGKALRRIGKPEKMEAKEEARKQAKKKLQKTAKDEVKREDAKTQEEQPVGMASMAKPSPSPSKTDSSPSISVPSAGRFYEHDPLFVQSDDGKDFLISANEREVQLLSLASSLLVRTSPAPKRSSIRCIAPDALDGNLTHIAYSNGSIATWDWTDDEPASSTFTANGHIIAMACVPELDGKSDLLYISTIKERYQVFTQTQLLFDSDYQLNSIQVLGDGQYIVLGGPTTLVVGMKEESSETTEDYSWVEVPLPEISTCLDARLLPIQPAQKKRPRQLPGLSLAVSKANGKIHLFDDVSPLFRQKDKASLPTPRILHWHRRAVSSVKFSRDGNYLISGGQETVLVLWQLATGKRQYLPHLTSEIDRIVVNPVGDRYAVQMADNSIMVLSTSELKPVANFAGLQMATQTPALDTMASLAQAAVLHPKHPNQLLITVPASRPKSEIHITARPYLQFFDVRASRHVARHALTRNNATDFSFGSDGGAIVPPDVTHLAISRDGQWLATVDEWTPPAADVEFLATDENYLEEERSKRREVYLKVWSWDETQSIWTLTNRFDRPHARANGSDKEAGKISCLMSDPASNGFATLGEDDCVKLWKPQRQHDVLAPQNKRDSAWRCKRTIQLSSGKQYTDLAIESAASPEVVKSCLAYSGDGSMLAATTQSSVNGAPVVHFVDVLSGEPKITKSNLSQDAIVAMAFLERYFVFVTRLTVYVWDLVNDNMVYKLNLERYGTTQREPMLAVNDGDGTFAVATHGQSRAKVEIYDPRKSECLCSKKLEKPVEAILAGKGARGYALLFADATVCTISSTKVVHPISPLSPHTDAQAALPETPLTQAAVEIDDAEATELVSTGAQSGQQRMLMVGHEAEGERPVVRPEQLANIFDVGESFALPPVRDMFQAVVGLYGRRPAVRPLVETFG